jgi:hypothetical protein
MKTTWIKVLQYGTDIPLGGVIVKICLSPTASGCNGAVTGLITGGNGEYSFITDQFRYEGVSSPGYWSLNYQPCFNLFYGDNATATTTGLHTADSLVIRIIPQSYITIHVQNNATLLDHDVTLVRTGYFYSCGFFPTETVILHPNIDSTFQFLIFGNSQNLFHVADVMDSSGNQNMLFQSQLYIPKDSSFTYHILY